MGVSSSQRFSATNPCPVCGGYDGAERGNGSRCYGFISDDGRFAHCSREEYAGNLEISESSSTFAHYLESVCRCRFTFHSRPDSSVNTNGTSKTKDKKPAKFDPERDKVFYYRDLAGKPLYAVVRMGGDKNK